MVSTTYPRVKYTFIFTVDGIRRQRTVWLSRHYLDCYNVSGLISVFCRDIANRIPGNAALKKIRCGKTEFQI